MGSRDQLATPYSWCASNGDFNANLDMLGARLAIGAMLDYRSYSLSSPSLSRWLPLTRSLLIRKLTRHAGQDSKFCVGYTSACVNGSADIMVSRSVSLCSTFSYHSGWHFLLLNLEGEMWWDHHGRGVDTLAGRCLYNTVTSPLLTPACTQGAERPSLML